jgi:hypothetical protein
MNHMGFPQPDYMPDYMPDGILAEIAPAIPSRFRRHASTL